MLAVASFLQSTTFASILAVLLAVLWWKTRKTDLPLPPGPRGWPIIGNLLDRPQRQEWLTYSDWGRRYGMSALSEIIFVLHPR
jgi:hypothetical protein